jgi:hypothetical protein
MSTYMQTTEERVQFVLNRITERESFAQEMRGKAVGASVTDAANYLKLAELAEAQVGSQRTTLLVLFPERNWRRPIG